MSAPTRKDVLQCQLLLLLLLLYQAVESENRAIAALWSIGFVFKIIEKWLESE